MLNIDFVLLVVLCLVQWKATQAQSSVCESSGLCQETGKSCKDDRINSCFPKSSNYLNIRTTYDDEDAGEEVSPSCINSRCTHPDTPSNITLQNVTLNYVSINPRYFKLKVSWSLTESSGNRGGYELRLTNVYDGTSSCYCIENSNQTRVTIHNLRYDNLRIYKSVDVLPYPHFEKVETDIKVSELLRRNITGCADVEHSGTLCGSKPYPKPENLRVESSRCGNDTKTLNISWDHPNVGADVPLPELYHIKLYSNPFNYKYTQRFTVQNASQVLLVNVNATQNYTIRVQPYRRCSGLGDASEDLGCGARTEWIKERIGDCDSNPPDSITTLYITEGTAEVHLNATRNVNLVLGLVSMVVAVTIVLVIAVSLAVLLCIKLNKHLKVKIHSCNFPATVMDYKVFVFYSPNMNQTHKEDIQKYVIFNLQKYFKVVTLDNINRGNISIWLEDAVNSADSVLLVGNKEFCSEWEQKERSPILNSFELLVSAAASQNAIAKFGFISIGESRMDVAIPDNSYLKLMPVFFMGKKKCEVENIYHFVTKTHAIELAQEYKHDEVKTRL